MQDNPCTKIDCETPDEISVDNISGFGADKSSSGSVQKILIEIDGGIGAAICANLLLDL